MPVELAASGGLVIGGVLYVVLLVTLGILSLRKGHWIMFIIGLFIPLFSGSSALCFHGRVSPRRRPPVGTRAPDREPRPRERSHILEARSPMRQWPVWCCN